jgi:2-C-methyl-D-erythritol 4-phosphate cytidylyltransferase
MPHLKKTAIILAGGKGSRMHSEIPKQYLDLNGKPVLYYSLEVFEKSCIDEIILVAEETQIDWCRQEIVEQYGFSKVVAIVSGGAQRYDSVQSGLAAMENKEGIVLIHDGARPLVSVNIIDRCIQDVMKYRACVAAVPVKDTIKIADESGFAFETPDRSTLWQIQTPQVFDCELILLAYAKMLCDDNRGNITDDAMIVEKYTDEKVKLTMGSYSNIKITTPEDMVVAKALLQLGVQLG